MVSDPRLTPALRDGTAGGPLADHDGVPRRTRGPLHGLARAVRPRQWSKNVLVFVAPAAAGVLRHPDDFLRTLAVFGIFCVAASGTYLLNDVADAEADRLHPKKRHRPIASGQLPEGLAAGVGGVLVAGAFAASWLLAGWELALVIGAYVAITVSYTVWLKREPVIELAAVAAGFVLRAIAGGVATHVPLSSWFLVVTSFGALFIVTGKRTAERKTLGTAGASHRVVLGEYSTSFLQSTLILTSSVTVTAYCLWAFERGGLSSRAGHLVLDPADRGADGPGHALRPAAARRRQGRCPRGAGHLRPLPAVDGPRVGGPVRRRPVRVNGPFRRCG